MLLLYPRLGFLCLLLGGLFLVAPTPASAQQIAVNPDYASQHLYSGRQYVSSPVFIAGSPNYRDWEILYDCDVVFDGLLYEQVPLMYDLVNDVLVTSHPHRQAYLELHGHLVSKFRIDEDHFIHIQDHDQLTSGFYHILHEGTDYLCYARYSRSVALYRGGTTMDRRYVSTSRFFVNDKNNESGFVEVRKLRDLLALNPAERRGIRRHLRQMNLRFRKHPVETVAAVLTYLDRSL